MNVFEQSESGVRSYSRRWPVVFTRGTGSHLFAEDGTPYLDFFAGAGTLNYGHNNPALKKVLLDYIAGDGVTHALDMFTDARRDLLETLTEVVLAPRGMDHKVLFPGPGGANAVEAALKLARTVTGRTGVVHFTNAFHGATLGALAVTGNQLHRRSAAVPLTGGVLAPFDGYFDDDPYPTHLARLLADRGSGLDLPAAVIVETVQGEGGINVARPEWLRGLAELCREHAILLVVDDVQMGCGRTGPFFSFEDAGIVPDIVCLSKSIGGFGLPMALMLLRPELDVWAPGAHNGTFRGVNVSFVTAAEALRTYWQDDDLEKSTRAKGERVASVSQGLVDAYPAVTAARGRGLVRGLEIADGLATKVAAEAFARGLLVETSGPEDQVVKLLPPLTVSDAELDEGLAVLEEAVRVVVSGSA